MHEKYVLRSIMFFFFEIFFILLPLIYVPIFVYSPEGLFSGNKNAYKRANGNC